MTTPGAKLDISVVMDSIGYLLRRTSQHFKEATVPALKRHGLSYLELTTLCLIHHNEHCILRTLAEAVGVEPPAMNRIINSLEEKGVVSRLKSPEDGRYTFFRLSQAGKDCMQPAIAEVQEVENEALSILTAKEREALFEALRQFF